MNSLPVLLVGVLAVAGAALAQQARYPTILHYSNDQNADGAFQYSYQTENGISASASAGPLARSIQGQYSYTGPDGQVYTIQYVSDENGYRPSGAHLPRSPPIPDAIQKSIEFNLRNNPELNGADGTRF